MVLIAEDTNAKVGPNVIPNDPNLQSENGKLLEGMIRRQDLAIVNTSNKCKGGPITRCRTVDGKIEKSCIAFILISRNLEHWFSDAIIDSSRAYILTKYNTTKGIPSVKHSDHYTLIANFQMEWE